MNFFKKAKKGFTLVELVVVIAVIAILAAVSVGAYFGVTESANNSKAEQEAKQAYTQLQTKTLAGLELGNSGMSVSLGNNGLTFNGLYDNNVLNQLSSLVFDQGTEIDVYAIDQVADVTEDSAVNARVFFLATSDSSSSAVAKYMGYVPANLSGKYVKYINLANGEFTKPEEITGTFKENNLPDTIKFDTISLKESFNLTDEDFENGYKTYGTYTSTNDVTYFGFGNKQKENLTGNYMQFRGKKTNEVSGISMTTSKGKLVYAAVDWNDTKTTDYSEAALFTKYGSGYGSDAETAVNFANTEVENIKFTNKDFVLPVTGNYFYGRIGAGESKYAYLDSVTFYYDTTAVVPEGEPSAIVIDKTEVSFFVEDFNNPTTQTITATVQGVSTEEPVTFEGYDDTIISVDANGVITPLKEGTTTIIAKSVNFPTVASQPTTVIVKTERVYTANLVTDLSEVVDDGTYVIANKQFNKAMSVVQNSNNRGEIELTNLSDDLEDYSLTFKTSDNIQLVTFEAVSTAEGAAFENSFALKVDNEKYLYSSSSSSNHLKTGNLIFNDTLSLNAVFEVAVDTNGNAVLKNNLNTDRTIRYNDKDKIFSCYKTGQNDIQLYSLDKDSLDRTLNSFSIQSNTNEVGVGKSINVSIDPNSYNPGYAIRPSLDSLSWTSSDDNIATVNEGKITGIAEGSVVISAKFDSCDYVANITISVVADAEIVTSLTKTSLGLTGSYTSNDVSVDNISFNFVQLMGGADFIQMRDKSGNTSSLRNTTAIPNGVKRIEFNYADSKEIEYSNQNAVIIRFGNENAIYTYETKLSTVAGEKSYIITPDNSNYTFIEIEHDLGYTLYWGSINLVY